VPHPSETLPETLCGGHRPLMKTTIKDSNHQDRRPEALGFSHEAHD
jgi:hypothetical protein